MGDPRDRILIVLTRWLLRQPEFHPSPERTELEQAYKLLLLEELYPAASR